MWQIVTPTGDVVAEYQVEKHAVLALADMRRRREAGAYLMWVRDVLEDWWALS